MNAKVQNYTAEQTAEVVAQYQNGTAVEAIAAQFGKTVKSIVAKLSREGVYVSAKKVKAEKRATKEDLINQIAIATGVDFDKLATLEKASKEALSIVADALSQDFIADAE